MGEAARQFKTIYDQHYGKALAYLRARGDWQAAEDLAAETSLVAWRRLGDIPDPPLPRLLGVARNLAREQRRASDRRQALAGRVEAFTGLGDLTGPDVTDRVVAGAAVRHALALLSARDRETLTLVAWLDLTAKDAARVVGCAPGKERA